jgi:hypothetical protein
MSRASRFLVGGAELVEDRGERGPGPVHEDGGVGAEHHLEGRPGQGVRGAETAQVFGQVEGEPVAVLDGAHRPLEALGQGHRGAGRVEHRRVPVGVGEGLRDRALGQPADLGQHPACGLDVHLRERPGAEPVPGVEELEEVELEVPQIRGVVAHACGSRCSVL